MAKGRQLKGRIRSVENTRKITRTMELVSTSKLKRAQDRVIAARPYAEALRQVIADLYTTDLADSFPLLRRPAPPSKGGPQRAAVILRYCEDLSEQSTAQVLGSSPKAVRSLVGRAIASLRDELGRGDKADERRHRA